MKLITGPKVYVVGRQTVDQGELDRFLADEGVSWETDTEVGGEKLVETAGRLCYLSFVKPRPGGNKAYIDNIIESGHGSVLEHAAWNMVFTGVSRSLSHELVRHRVGISPSQLSQRYVDESVAEYVVPPDLRLEVDAWRYMEAISKKPDQDGYMTEAQANERWPDVAALADADIDAYYDATSAGKAWVTSVELSHSMYVFLSEHLTRKWWREEYRRHVASPADPRGCDLLAAPLSREEFEKATPREKRTAGRKFARQAARSVLPNATETKIFATANARALRHFIELRASRHADPEIRVLAHGVWKKMVSEAPALFSDYREVPLDDGTFELTTEHRKV